MERDHGGPDEVAGVSDAVIGEALIDVDGREYRMLWLADQRGADDAAIEALREILECGDLEAEHAYRIIREDGEFITSVHDDIARLDIGI